MYYYKYQLKILIKKQKKEIQLFLNSKLNLSFYKLFRLLTFRY